MRSGIAGKAVIAAVVVVAVTTQATAGSFIAYSMKEAERRIRSGGRQQAVFELGGITRVAAVVFDEDHDDCVIVGQTSKREPQVTLDDFVVALRSRLIHKEWPVVSIDRTPETQETGMQKVRFEGGIENTQFGFDLLEADVILKKLSLGVLPAGVWGVRSYFDMAAERAGRESGENMRYTRWWYFPRSHGAASRAGVAVCREFAPGVRTELMDASVGGEKVQNIRETRNDLAEAFARRFSESYDDLGVQYPEIARVSSLLRLIVIAHGVEATTPHCGLRYWLEEYNVDRVDSPTEFSVLAQQRQIEAEKRKYMFTIEGGVKLRATLDRLKYEGDIAAIRDLVAAARPQDRALTWRVPLDGWRIPGYSGQPVPLETNVLESTEGCSIIERLNAVDSCASPSPLSRFRGSSIPFETPGIRSSLSPSVTSPNVGGVLLSGVGKGEGDAGVDLSGGKFSLVVGGENARLAPEMHGKFVTALWAVYFGQTVPGISIDPIYQDPETGAFSDKHMVRYIGRVVNTDLGRVMRETDYLMKKWSVGSERPRIRGFRTPDDYSGRSRTIYSSLSRFWLTPEDMSFQAADDMLLFDGGNMKVKTQVLGYDIGKEPSNPHNEAFARFFSEHYAEIAEEYPVFEELQDYGKLVALARYLKESGVPLLWFLLANKDQVITEDSPGTVDNLAKQSEYWRGVTIQGGVDMSEPGQYVYDDSAVTAVRQAWQKRQSHPERSASMGDVKRRGPSIPFSFDVDDNRYTVVPQHSLTCGKDHRGIRYQTDFCMRAEGYRVSDKTVRELNAELFRYAMRKHLATELKDGTAEQADSERERVSIECCARARTTVDDLQDRIDALRGKKYASKAACAESWKAVMKGTPVAELDAVFVEQCHFVSNLELVRCFNPARREAGPFGAGWKPMIPYRVKAAGEKTIAFRNVVIPEQMQVYNQITGDEETLLFSTNRYTVAGYVPPGGAAASQWVGLFLLSDTSYRLVDKVGSEFRFDPSGCLTEMALSPEYRVEIEYLREPTDAFTRIPYVVRTVGAEKKWLRGANLPTCVEVVDVVHKTRETFDLTSEKSVLGYAPREADKSRYQFLALMNDASYRLLDKHGNEIDLSSNGVFERLDPGEEDPVVKRISSGGHGIDFAYTIGASGELMIARAELTGEHELPGGVDSVVYEYDDDNRLCAARRERKAAVATVDEFRGGLAGL